jgi:hypothetical protein
MSFRFTLFLMIFHMASSNFIYAQSSDPVTSNEALNRMRERQIQRLVAATQPGGLLEQLEADNKKLRDENVKLKLAVDALTKKELVDQQQVQDLKSQENCLND